MKLPYSPPESDIIRQQRRSIRVAPVSYLMLLCLTIGIIVTIHFLAMTTSLVMMSMEVGGEHEGIGLLTIMKAQALALFEFKWLMLVYCLLDYVYLMSTHAFIRTKKNLLGSFHYVIIFPIFLMLAHVMVYPGSVGVITFAVSLEMGLPAAVSGIVCALVWSRLTSPRELDSE